MVQALARASSKTPWRLKVSRVSPVAVSNQVESLTVESKRALNFLSNDAFHLEQSSSECFKIIRSKSFSCKRACMSISRAASLRISEWPMKKH